MYDKLKSCTEGRHQRKWIIGSEKVNKTNKKTDKETGKGN